MRDPADIYTPHGTSLIILISRLLFAIYFVFAVFSLETKLFPNSTLTYFWLLYMLAIYYLAERAYIFFGRKNIDLSYAFPLLIVLYVLNLASILLNGQDRIPLMNRAEHFLSFILLTYIIWIFFLKYLPQDVWRNHPYYTALIVLAFASMFGVFNEIVELLFDSLLGTKLIGNKLDTPLDLLMNTLGSILLLSTSLVLGSIEGNETKG